MQFEFLSIRGAKIVCFCWVIVAEQEETIKGLFISLESWLGGGGRFLGLRSWSISIWILLVEVFD